MGTPPAEQSPATYARTSPFGRVASRSERRDDERPPHRAFGDPTRGTRRQ